MYFMWYNNYNKGRWWKERNEEENKLKNLINNCEKVKFLIFNYQIEDWIVYSLTRRLDPNPAEYLKTHYQYEKYKLDEYADKLEFEILKNLDSFYKFIQYIKLEKCFSWQNAGQASPFKAG